IVWQQVVALLEDPTLIQREVSKRVEETGKASPVIKQKALIEKQKAKLFQSIDKLLDAYQESLITIAQLRKRMPELQKRVNTTEKELENLTQLATQTLQIIAGLGFEGFRFRFGGTQTFYGGKALFYILRLYKFPGPLLLVGCML